MSAPPRGVLAVDKYFVLKSTCVTKKRLIRDKLYVVLARSARSVRAQTASENDFGAGAPATGCDLPGAGPAEGMPNDRGSFDAGPCAHVYRHSPKHPVASVI